MSDILHKTFKAILGPDDGVGWATPTASSPHSLSQSLAACLKQLALVPLSKEKEVCRKHIDHCESILARPDCTPGTATECIVRGVFIHLIGQDASRLQIHAVKLAQAPNLLQRKLGYLACSVLLPTDSEFRLLLTNCIMRELATNSIPCILTGLVAACNLICDSSILSLLVEKVMKLVTSESHLVRTKALVTLDRFCQISPCLWMEVENVVIGRLSDDDPSVVSTAIQMLAKYLRCDPDKGLSVLDPVLHVQKQIVENRLPAEFKYRGLVGPWIQVHILRVVSKFNRIVEENSRVHASVSELIGKHLEEEFSKEPMTQILLSEAVLAVTRLNALKHLVPTALKHVSKFLQSKQNHLKYTGLGLLEQIFSSSPPTLNPAQEENVIFCLEHPDPAIQFKTLSLLTVIATKENVKTIVDSVLGHLKKTSSLGNTKKDVVHRGIDLQRQTSFENAQEYILKVYSVIDSLSEDLDWKTSSILRLIQCSKGKTKDKMVEHLKFLLSPLDNQQVTESNAELDHVRKKIKKLLKNLVENGVRNPVIFELLVWTSAQFSTQQTAKEATEVILESVETMKRDPSHIRHVLNAILTIKLRTGSIEETAKDFVLTQTNSENKIIRKEAMRVTKLLNLTEKETSPASDCDTISGVSEAREAIDLDLQADPDVDLDPKVDHQADFAMDFSEMDLTLSFLDTYVLNSLGQGGEPYIPSVMRLVPGLLKSPEEEKPLLTTPYSRLRQDTVGSVRTQSSSSPTPTVQAQKVWTLEGRIEDGEKVEEPVVLKDVVPETKMEEKKPPVADSLLEGW